MNTTKYAQAVIILIVIGVVSLMLWFFLYQGIWKGIQLYRRRKDMNFIEAFYYNQDEYSHGMINYVTTAFLVLWLLVHLLANYAL